MTDPWSFPTFVAAALAVIVALLTVIKAESALKVSKAQLDRAEAQLKASEKQLETTGAQLKIAEDIGTVQAIASLDMLLRSFEGLRQKINTDKVRSDPHGEDMVELRRYMAALERLDVLIEKAILDTPTGKHSALISA